MEKGKDKTIIIFLSIVRPTTTLNSKKIGKSRVNNFNNRFILGSDFSGPISSFYINDHITAGSNLLLTLIDYNN